MTDSNDRDFIGEVIAEDDAKRMQRASVLKETDVSYAANVQAEVQTFWCHEASNIKCVRASDYDELRQQLAYVSNERDGLRQLSVTNILLDVVPGADGMGHEIYAGSVSAVQLIMDTQEDEIEALQLRLNASEARNAELESLVSDVLTAFRLEEDGSCINPGRDFIRPWAARVGKLAQSAPATDEHTSKCGKTGHRYLGGTCLYCNDTGTATDEQGAGS